MDKGKTGKGVPRADPDDPGVRAGARSQSSDDDGGQVAPCPGAGGRDVPRRGRPGRRRRAFAAQGAASYMRVQINSYWRSAVSFLTPKIKRPKAPMPPPPPDRSDAEIAQA